MRRALRLSDWPWVVVNVGCGLCPRRGRYRLARLAARLGPETELERVLAQLAGDCGLMRSTEIKPRHYEARCGVRFEDLAYGKLPPPSLPPAEMPILPRRNRAPVGPLPTIGDSRAQGIASFTVHCEARIPKVWCHHQADFPLDAAGLPDSVPFLDIAKLPWRCGRCGGRKVGVRANWPDPRKLHARALGVDTTPRLPGTVPIGRAPGLHKPATPQ